LQKLQPVAEDVVRALSGRTSQLKAPLQNLKRDALVG
jgi:hypothetical protein